ncbi:hypothetical protein DBB29_00665 [Pandoraea cepalis]|uniref:Uncharacterized protein n=2 Tax=Pandoraea cepalis TaxID=2508294 RepID=A0AAW7MGV0_9BURK|nr:hypothetical protein [Pandoraea cepalis]MDN4576645.1 hypothetical protein [Pandoraea cepalis]
MYSTYYTNRIKNLGVLSADNLMFLSDDLVNVYVPKHWFYAQRDAIFARNIATFAYVTMDDTVKHDQLMALVAVGGVRSVTIVATFDGFLVRINTSVGDSTLISSRGKKPRPFKRLETLLVYLKNDIGIGKATIEFENWTPAQKGLKAAKN